MIPFTSSDSLDLETRRRILAKVLEVLDARFYKPELLDARWHEAVEVHRPLIEASPTRDAFEHGVGELLKSLQTSHLGFFHRSATRASSRAALSATYTAETVGDETRWVFQDVHDGGPAASAGIRVGNVLLTVNGSDIRPPVHPVFPMGSTSSITALTQDDESTDFSLLVARPKGKKLHFIEPTLVQADDLGDGIGYMRVAMFPGMVGIDVSTQILRAADRLAESERLVIDLRGNTGGGVGGLRLMSLLTSDRVPVGFAPDRKWAHRDLAVEKERFPRFNRIPASKSGLWLLGMKFGPALLRKKPIVLETEGLGPRRFHGRVCLLVNRHTASMAEMVVMFAKENGLATLVGEPTAGRLLSATSVQVGSGYRLALPVGAYHTWHGATLEGSPIEPNLRIGFDWQDARKGNDEQLNAAIRALRKR